MVHRLCRKDSIAGVDAMHRPRHHLSNFIRRLGAALVIVAAALAADGTPAFAHSGASDASNYVSTITDPGHPGLQWTMYGGDALIELTNGTDEELIVEGYEGEPYLKFVPGDGVYQNIHSPAVYYNTDRYANAELPAVADHTAAPEWERVASGEAYAWHDHRAHWMSPVPPSGIFSDPDTAQKVFDWSFIVRGAIDGSEHLFIVRGTLSWVPAVAWWPPVLALSVVFGGIALLAALRTRPKGTRWTGLARPVAVIIWVVMAANVVRTIDDIFAVPTATGERITMAVTAAVTIAVIVALTLVAWRGEVWGFLALLGAGVATWLLFGNAHSVILSGSQVVTGLPDWIARWVVAASFAVMVPVLVACGFAGRHFWRLRQPTVSAASTPTPAG